MQLYDKHWTEGDKARGTAVNRSFLDFIGCSLYSYRTSQPATGKSTAYFPDFFSAPHSSRNPATGARFGCCRNQ
jgi:hypothetical protein